METINIDFNEPYELTEIFRYKDILPTGEKILDEEGDITDETKSEMREFKHKAWICWENIAQISGYPYQDDWNLKGEKYFIKFNGSPNEMLVLGSMSKTVALWKLFRTIYPVFTQPGGYSINYKPIVVDEQEDENVSGTSTE